SPLLSSTLFPYTTLFRSNIDADSTFALALEAQARGHALFHYLPDALTLHDGRLYARARPLEVMRRQGNHHRFGSFEELDLAGVRSEEHTSELQSRFDVVC